MEKRVLDGFPEVRFHILVRETNPAQCHLGDVANCSTKIFNSEIALHKVVGKEPGVTRVWCENLALCTIIHRMHDLESVIENVLECIEAVFKYDIVERENLAPLD